ncbi:hypothetical protein Z950_248 [Sulfitobacter mediterraneus KCTC 32188]|nr:hypothetical protein Z950_248 [Sulfitobacter mediterraneus KCTC 32188]
MGSGQNLLEGGALIPGYRFCGFVEFIHAGVIGWQPMRIIRIGHTAKVT